MQRSLKTVWLAMLMVISLGVSVVGYAQDNTKRIVVTTSMLATAVEDVVGNQPTFRVMTLLPPGACPGHFDLKPDVLPALRQSVLVIRHDYQNELEKKIASLGGEPVRVLALKTTGSLLIPKNYLHLLEHVTAACSELDPGNRETYDKNLQATEIRLVQLTKDSAQKRRAWRGQPVVAAIHQADYTRYLGFEVVGVLKRTEDMTPRDLQRLQQVQAVMVIGNYQSNAQGALALGKRMRLPVAVVSNFPGAEACGRTYDDLVKYNMKQIEKAWAQHD